MTEAPPQVRPGFIAPPRVDWFRILVDLEVAGLCNAEVARRLGLLPQRLYEWKKGKQPMHGEGSSLVELYRWVYDKDAPKIKSK